MGLFGHLFGNKPSLEKMQRALQQGNFAEALHIGEDLSDAVGTDSDLAVLMTEATDGLARLNLDEGIRSLQAGDVALATEHLQLARAQAGSAELIQEIEALSQQGDTQRVSVEVSEHEKPSSGHSSCGSCAPTSQPATVAVEDLPDLQSQIELLIASYPLDMQQAYLAASDLFLQSFLLIQNGEDQQALEQLRKIPATQRDSIYLFELGSIYSRLGDFEQGLTLLHESLVLDPGNLLVVDAVLHLLAQQEDFAGALSFLQAQLNAGADSAFCHGRSCEFHSALQNNAAALSSACLALEAGYAEGDFLVLAADLFEQAGKTTEAESLLLQLPGGGCGGGVSLPLAEFWLRQNRELEKILDAFNGACRQEPENPRWQLRVAQTYLARNWRKQGIELLQRVVGDPRLQDHLRVEAEQLLLEQVGDN